jgi:RES domain
VNLGACRKLDQSPETGVWYRAVRLAHLTTPINTAHTKSTPSRFSPGPSANPPFEILYLSESPQVAQFEIGALAGDPLVVGGILNAQGSFAAIYVKVVLQRIADLTVLSQQDLIESTAQELTGDWRGYQHRAAAGSSIQEPVGTKPTQDLGEVFSVYQE